MTPLTLRSLPKTPAQIFPHITWSQFEAIDHAFASVPGVKLCYLDGQLEIMPISEEHEEIKATLSLLLEAYFRYLGIRFYKRGGPSLGSRELKSRNEPDESYNLDSRKPFPDLVIEVVMSSGGLNKLEGYSRMGIREVWFWEDGKISIYYLEIGSDTETTYRQVDSSVLIPDLSLDKLCQFILFHDQYDAVEAFVQEIRGE
jgi:Uma2 family endonuclease